MKIYDVHWGGVNGKAWDTIGFYVNKAKADGHCLALGGAKNGCFVQEWETNDEPELNIPTEPEIRQLIDDYRLECPEVRKILFRVGRLEYFTRAISALSAKGYENVTIEFNEYGTIESDDDEGAEDD